MKRFAKLLIAFVILPAVLPVASYSQDTSDRPDLSALIHVNIVSMTSNHVLNDYAVVIQGNTIKEISPMSTAKIIPGANIIDAQGQYLLPGLIDTHTHLHIEVKALNAFVGAGVTTVFSLAGNSEILEWKNKIKAGLMIGPDIYTTGPILDGAFERPLVKVVTESEQAIHEVKDQIERGYDFIKVYSSLKQEVYQSIIEIAREHRFPVIGHIPFQVEIDSLLTSHQKLIAHTEEFLHKFQEGFSSDRPFDFYEIDEAKAKETARKAGGAKIFVSTTLVGFKALIEGIENKLDLESNRNFHFFPDQMQQDWIQLIQQRRELMDAKRFDQFKKAYQFLKGYVKLLNDHGVILLAGTDTPYLPILPGFSLHDELQLLVDSGLTPFEALATATRNVGKFLNRTGSVGTIEIGANANLILLEDNPLEKIEATRKISGVLLRGQWYSRDKLIQILQEMKQR